VVSDTHLSPRTREADANWDAVVARVAADPPAVVVHAGDISADGADRTDDLDHARAQLDRLQVTVPVHTIPGNHDVGDNPHGGYPSLDGTGTVPPALVEEWRLARFRDRIGPDRWVVDIGGWRLVGLNAQLLGSGLREEGEQWDWLTEVLSSPGGDAHPVALFVHKPLLRAPSLPDDPSPGRYVPSAAGDRLRALMSSAERRVRAVVSGHAHQFCVHRHDGVAHVWAPTTWAVIPDRAQPAIGRKVSGVVDLTLDGIGATEAELAVPAGLTQWAIGDDIPNPYRH
jgi:3',5'-cyclic AMP phosphodiesterase CpdA